MAFISKKAVVPFFSPLARREKCKEKKTMHGKLHLSGLLLPLLFLFSFGHSQTFTPISPTGNGGFETGPTFSGNGWIEVQPNISQKWFVGNAAGVQGGIRAAYVGSSTTHSGSTTTGVFHFYRDIEVPAGAINVNLNFYYKQPVVDNSGTADTFYVFTTTTANTPVSGIVPSTGYTQRFSNSAIQYNNWVAVPTINLSSLAGTTVRLVFSFRNNGNSPNANPAVDYISLTYIIPCTGTPSGGTTVLSPATGAPSSNFNGSVTGGSSTGAGLSYQWQIAIAPGGPWADISGATGATASLTAVPFASTTRYYRRRIRCSYSGAESYSSTASFTTSAVTYCTPTSQVPSGLYINNLQVFGMTDTPANISTYSLNGYSNFTGNNALTVKQAQGEGINIEAFSIGGLMYRGRWKAWVDWNGDGDFTDSGEEVFNGGTVLGENAGFGFEVPPNQTPGKYRLRIRVNNSRINGDGTEMGGFNFSPCDNFTTTTGTNSISNYGETEDYAIEVIENCVAKIAGVVPGSACNTPAGTTVNLAVTSNQPVTEFRWYTTQNGGSYVSTLPDGSGMSTTWATPTISQTTTYYVTAFNGTCESTFRTEITAEVLPTPEIEFTSSSYDICGENSIVEVSALGDNEIVHLIDVNFEDGTLGGFINQRLTTNNPPEVVDFINRTSVYKPSLPTYLFWRPAISSGFGPNKFVLANADANVGVVGRALRSPLSINTQGLETLNLSFRMFFSRYFVDGINPAFEYVAIEVSNNNGSSWTELDRFTGDVGRPGKFETKTYNLNAYVNQENLTFRFRLYADPMVPGEWQPSGLALDDIELYGEKPLEPSFDWVSDHPIGVFTDEEGTIPYEGEPISTVYFIPTPEQLTAFETWDVTATAELENGCTASGDFELTNSTKIWDALSGTWSVQNWKPGPAVPTADNCVIIRTPVFVPDLTDGLAKNLKVELGGSLTIQSGGSLTITDFITNEATAADFVVESDANLVQVSPGGVNTGEITVRRAATVPSNQYNYWASPVADQLLYSIYPNIPNNRIMTYNTWNDYFTIIPYGSLSAFGIGYSIKGPTSNSPNNSGGGTGVMAEFIGVPQNESLAPGANNIPLSNVNNAYNLIGNPYPSNLNLDELYNLNSNNLAIDATFNFWDNTYNTIYVQQGSGYVGGNYAFYNVNSGGTPASGGDEAKIPNGIVKPGQGFIVQSLTGAPLILDNRMRTKEVKIDSGDPDAPYYKNSEGVNDTHKRKDKFWLDLVTPTELHVKILIGYFEQAEDTFEKFDSKILSESLSDNFYSFSNDAEKLAIQGRQGLFHDDDVIPLGIKTFRSGKHKIQLQERLGLFVSHQEVYLKDKYLGIIHNLSESDYEIDLQNGLVEDRFEIVFKDGNSEEEPILTAASQVNIQKIDKQILITSSKDKIQEVEIFNLSGWSVYTKTRINANEFRIPVKNFDHQIIVVKVRTETGEIVTKKLVN